MVGSRGAIGRTCRGERSREGPESRSGQGIWSRRVKSESKASEERQEKWAGSGSRGEPLLQKKLVSNSEKEKGLERLILIGE